MPPALAPQAVTHRPAISAPPMKLMGGLNEFLSTYLDFRTVTKASLWIAPIRTKTMWSEHCSLKPGA